MTAEKNHPELIERLAEGISNLTSSEEWQHYLDFQSRFHRYSFNNVLLIAARCHESTKVAGFNALQKINRFVHKGEKAIWIRAPMVYKNADSEDGEPEKGHPGLQVRPRIGCPPDRRRRAAHSLQPPRRRRPSRVLAELAAEYTTYVVCQAFGIDSSD
jgi:hypothetical protein